MIVPICAGQAARQAGASPLTGGWNGPSLRRPLSLTVRRTSEGAGMSKKKRHRRRTPQPDVSSPSLWPDHGGLHALLPGRPPSQELFTMAGMRSYRDPEPASRVSSV